MNLHLGKTVYIYVCGIMTFPGESGNWTGKAVTWTQTRPELPAEKIEYFSPGLFSRSIGQEARAEKLVKTLNEYLSRGRRIILVAHSNGCDVALDALQQMGWPRIEALHLISGACEADFDQNGLNLALALERIGRVVVYVAKRDIALYLAASPLGRCFGYGDLGRTGPVNQDFPVETVVEPEFGHSDWFHGDHFEVTMRMLTGGDPQLTPKEGHT